MLYDQHRPFLLLNINVLDIRVQFTDYLCCIFVILGVIGNVLGLSIFSSSRRIRRISSTYVYLATSSSIINLLCVVRYALILHSKSQMILRELVGHVWFACKMYELSFLFRVISSWITLFWMFERLTCISKKLRTFFYRWNRTSIKFLIPILLLILNFFAVILPPLLTYQPQISPYVNPISHTQNLLIDYFRNKATNSTVSPMYGYCGLNSDVSIKWKKYFNEISFGFNHYTIRCLFSELIPAGGIIIFNICILYYLCRTSHNFDRKNCERKAEERKRTTSWMNAVLIFHSFLFFLSLLSHIIGHLMSVEAHETWWVLLAVLTNCSLNFYIYCLSGRAFRQQIRYFFQQITTKKFAKLRSRKDQWEQRRSNQLIIYQRNAQPRPIQMNSSSPFDDEQSPK